jgi:hypothetical protein
MRSLLIVVVSLVALLALFGDVSAAKAKRQQQEAAEFDTDEFSEFDSVDDDESTVKMNKGSQKQQAAPSQASDKADEFSSFDQESDFDGEIDNGDDSENVRAREQQQQQQSSKNEPKPQQQKQKQQQPKKVANSFGVNMGDDLDSEEFEHFVDDDEFENFETNAKTGGGASSKDSASSSDKKTSSSKSDSSSMPSLKITDVPKHLLTNGNWQSYVWEIVMIVIIFVYFANFLYGKSQNNSLATAWFRAHKELLERHFALVGDTGTTLDVPTTTTGDAATGESKSEENASDSQSSSSSDDISSRFIRESENNYALWCSGKRLVLELAIYYVALPNIKC